MNLTRRRLVLGSAACVLLSGCRSSPPPAPKPTTPEQARYLESRERMLKRFGRPGFELVVDAMDGQEFLGVEFFPEDAKYPFYQKGGQRLQTQTKMVLSQPVPERVRVVWRDSSKFVPDGRALYAGNIIGDEIFEVGSRIPQALIDELKRDPRGNLRLKFRMSEQGTLLGWDIERRPGFDPKKRDEYGEAVYVAPVHSFAGGDFREAKILDGKPVRKGWYLDKRTGRKIETDY
ncbi:hypothetical protein B447_00095 [Thauera sp. 27]|uniref:hypothetical protein n=1 Tax=Thauera sp. 27 TaxID=305700 RepID=UPI0002CDCE73|nr:hypothetical protein [Thauera sp. 27]ENO83146.1 hypothetical protein B447_00095 [Thauera sp. 27]